MAKRWRPLHLRGARAASHPLAAFRASASDVVQQLLRTKKNKELKRRMMEVDKIKKFLKQVCLSTVNPGAVVWPTGQPANAPTPLSLSS